MLQKLFVITFLSTLSVGALCACPKYQKVYGMLDLKSNTLKEIDVNKNAEELCGILPVPVNANLLITITKNKVSFETKIYRSFHGYFDLTDKKKKAWKGGAHVLPEIEITGFIPDWYKDSTLTITELTTNKVLAETKLK